jgi:ubiquinone/menaquinone biosynthesis C-methylase UbiE
MKEHCVRYNTGHLVPSINISKLFVKILQWKSRREELYDRLYSMDWGNTTTNNYGFAPADGHEAERFQTQLYTELLNLLDHRLDFCRIARVLEISCGRGGGLGHLARHLPPRVQLIGLDFSAHAIAFCQERYAAVANLDFVRGHALQLPFEDGSFDLVINVEASHVYGNDAAFLREVRRVLNPQGRFLFADYRTRRKVPMLERLAGAAGLAGELRDITPNVVRACELDAERRRRIIRTGLPWYTRLLLTNSLEGYSSLPGTLNFERFRSGDRMYFLTCLSPCQQDVGLAQRPVSHGASPGQKGARGAMAILAARPTTT